MFRPAGNTEQGYWAVLKKNIQKDWGVAVNIPTSWQPWARLLGGAEYSERVGGVVNILGQLATLGKVTGRDRRRIFRKNRRLDKYSGTSGNTEQGYCAGQKKNIQKEWAGW
jgi:hypothetical protein